ncbi:MAG: PspC domain-containing protein [Cyclobacteriaceae bacterium]
MKKTITINISGIVFHIEEDGYELLKTYLDSVKKHFLSFKDSQEIITDIESRIAEIFMSRISETKQALTAEDVNYLIRTMGQPSEFTEATETEEHETGTQSGSGASAAKTFSKKLFRDNRKKVLGGVCAGLAHYFRFDPAWVRLLFALLIFAGGFIIIAYILMWAIIPGSDFLEDQTSIKKIYRDAERKVIGGVAAGIASYTGTDISVIRLIFAGLVFAGGFGVILYIILWLAIPEAKTLTEKMEMQGQPVTLSNIEKTIKEKLNEKEGEESALAKIILFPFRVIATIITAIGSAIFPFLKALGKIIAIAIGIILTVTGAALTLAILIVGAMLIGVWSSSSGAADWIMLSGSLPLETFHNTFSVWTILFASLTLFIPSLLLSLLGISLIINRSVLNKVTGWSILAIFMISLAVTIFTIPSAIMKFSEDGYFKRERSVNTNGHVPLLKIKHTGMENYVGIGIRIHSHDASDIRIIEKFNSQGSSRSDAEKNAKMTDYNIIQQDSIITFDSNITFKKDAAFRAQRLLVDIYFPLNKPFVIEQELYELIHNYGGYYHEDRDRNTYLFDEGGLKCLTCEEDRLDSEEENYEDIVYNDNEQEWAGEGTTYKFKNFTELSLAGYFDATIEKGNRYSVVIEDDELFKVSQEGNKLIVKTEDQTINLFKFKNRRRVHVRIRMPELKKLDATGSGKFEVRGFKSQFLEISQAGAVKGTADLNAVNLDINLIGASKLKLSGNGRKMDVSLTGASKLEAYDFSAETGEIDAVGASTAEVNISGNLNSNAILASRIKNKGKAEN